MITALFLLASSALLTPDQQARADMLYQELRCVACQNQSIAESEAEIANVMRRMVDQRLAAGDSDEAVRAYVIDRYGEYVLLNPSLSPKNYLLWAGPLIALTLGGIGAFFLFRRAPAPNEKQ